VRAFRPDVIATDPLAYAGAIAGEQHGIPWAAISSSLVAIRPRGFRCDYIDHLEALAPERDRMCAAAGVTLRFASGEAVSPSLNTVFATAALDVGETEHSHAIRVGPSSVLGSRGDETEFPWHRLRADRPLLYAAFGSQLAPPASAFQAIAEGVDPEVADLVLAFSDADVLPALPDHAIVVRWAPQRQLLQRAAAMVTHGGANSFSEGLTAGTPMLVVPIGHEQPVQAELAVRCGAGRALAPAQLTAARMRALAGELLEDGPLRSRAAELGRSYAAADGAKQAAELLVEVGA
jgi:MGT family glycosyltransferase